MTKIYPEGSPERALESIQRARIEELTFSLREVWELVRGHRGVVEPGLKPWSLGPRGHVLAATLTNVDQKHLVPINTAAFVLMRLNSCDAPETCTLPPSRTKGHV